MDRVAEPELMLGKEQARAYPKFDSYGGRPIFPKFFWTEIGFLDVCSLPGFLASGRIAECCKVNRDVV